MSSVDLTPQYNFASNTLPHDTGIFYNSRGFAQNEIHILGVAINMMQRGLEEGLKEMKNAIDGLS